MITNTELRDVGKGTSFFSFIDEFSLEENSRQYISRAIHRLCTLMRKMDARSVIIESITHDDDLIKKECEAINTYYDQQIDFKINRFTFLLNNISSTDQAKEPDTIFLSSAVIINYNEPIGNWRTYLYNAIITTPKKYDEKNNIQIPLLNNYLHIFNTFDCQVKINDDEILEYKITGTYFCQQNSITSVCAHASLCMTINNMGRGIISPEDINEKIGINHIDIKFGVNKDGLQDDEMMVVLRSYGLAFTWMNFFENPNIEYNEYIYSYIESRCPVLLVFSTDTSLHVVPVLGHTLNSDIWRPEAEPAYNRQLGRLNYKTSAAWVDHFVIHDDNFGMYFCLPIGALKRVTLPKYDRIFRSCFAVAIIPSSLKTPAWEAEWASMIVTKDILNRIVQNGSSIDEWSQRILQSESNNSPRPIIARTLFVKKDDYKKSLNEMDFKGNYFSDTEKIQLLENLPDSFWLSEITLPDLYTANKTKVIDFFYTSDKEPTSDNNEIANRWIQIRFPKVLLSKDINGNLQAFPMTVESHYPLYRFEDSEAVCDW